MHKRGVFRLFSGFCFSRFFSVAPLFLVCVCGGFFLAGCLGCSGGGSSASASSSSSPSPPETSEGGERITIYFIPRSMGNSYFEALAVGFNNAIAQLGEHNFRFVYTGPDGAGALRQLPYIEEAVKAKADAIFIAANSDTALNGAFDTARAAGVRVYIINQDIPGSETHRDAAILPVNFEALGRAQVDVLGTQMGYRGEFAILSSTRDAPDQNAWIAYMREELNKPKYSRMRLVDVVYGNEDTEASRTAMRELVAAYPTLGGVIALTPVGLPAAASVVRDMGRAAKIKITGVGLPSQMEEFVLDGTCEGFHLWNPSFQGYLAAFLVWNEKREGLSLRPGAVFSAGRLGEYTILPSGQIYVLEAPVLYNKTNIQEHALLF